MKVPWKYKKVSAREFDNLHRTMKHQVKDHHSPNRFYCNSHGRKWYRFKTAIIGLRQPWHWTRWIPCSELRPGKNIVDCFCGIRNGRGKLFWLVGRHYVGMCPFKNKWKYGLKLKSMVGMKGRK